MDTAGKDGAIKHVMSGVNPQGCKVASFKTPTPIEARHDFLWRAVLELPERGMIGVFNRSYYEAVLIERVHPELLATEGVYIAPEKLDKFWDDRLRAIRHFERHLTDSGTTLVKIFLHISKDEQRRRLLERIDDPMKAWKASRRRRQGARFWKDYRHAYEAALSATSIELCAVAHRSRRRQAQRATVRLSDRDRGTGAPAPRPAAARRNAQEGA